jgi:class 3 adenylate cyclase
LIWYHRAQALGVELGKLSIQAAALGNVGTVYLLQSEHEQALDQLHRAHDLFLADGNFEATGPLLLNIGMIHGSRGDLATALEWYYRALELFTIRKNDFGIGHASGAIGDLFYDIAEYDQALHWYEEALQIFEANDYQIGAVNKYCQLGRVYGSMQNAGKEVANLTRAVALAAAYSLGRELVIARTFLAKAALRNGDLDRAVELIDAALPDARGMGLREQELELQLTAAKVAVIQQRHDAAVELFSAVLTDAGTLGLEKVVREAHQQLYELERDRDTSLALYHLEQVVEIRDRHLSEQKHRRMALLEMEHKLSVERRDYQAQVEQERRLREQQRELLTNMMPERIAESLMAGATMIADSYDDVSIMFLDLVNFTELASAVTAAEVVVLLNGIFNACDEVIMRHGLTKIKTIGDAYLAVGGAPDPLDDHAVRMALAAIEVNERLQSQGLAVRIGLHCGPITAGVIGEYRKAYDVWGDAVNVAARMEQSCERGRIHASADFAQQCIGRDGIQVEVRGLVDVKGKGQMTTYWLSGA